MLNLFFIVWLAILGAIVGAVVGALGRSPSVVIAFSLVGAVVGLIVGVALVVGNAQHDRKRRRNVRVRREAPPPVPPRRFGQRLAEFVQRDEAQPGVEATPYKSSMPFYLAVAFFARIPPKSVAMIRHALRRIQRLARPEA